MARSTVDNRLDTLDIGLDSTVGTSVGVGDLDTKGNALTTIITLRHFVAPPIGQNSFHASSRTLEYNNRVCRKKQALFSKFFEYFFGVAIAALRLYNIVITNFGGIKMAETYAVPLSQVVSQFDLEVAWRSTDYDRIQITVADVARPGLQIAGYFDHFEPMRLQIIGNVESSYLDKMSAAERTLVYDRLFSYKSPAIIAARGLVPGPECLEMARKHNITILRWPGSTSSIVSSIIAYLTRELAPRVTRHGVLMEIYGEGVLLTGESGIGKSETAVELIKRGHRLIADDAVEIKRVSSTSLVGSAPPLIQNYIELRGIGIINVATLFGAGSVKDSASIDLVVNIVPWDTREVYDRLGLEDHFYELLGVRVPLNTIPVTPGRNLAVILEVAAMNNRQRRMGYNAAQEFTAQINKHLMQSV